MDEEDNKPSMLVRSKTKESNFKDPTYFQELVDKWTRPLQVWPFRFGDDIIEGAAIISSAYGCYYMRFMLRMAHYARFGCYAPSLFFTFAFTELFQKKYITGQIINFSECPVCTQVKSGVGQAMIGGVLPFISSSIVSFYYANLLLSYPLPSLSKAPKELAQVWLKFVNRNRTVLLCHLAFQAIVAGYVTYHKQVCYVDLMDICFK